LPTSKYPPDLTLEDSSTLQGEAVRIIPDAAIPTGETGWALIPALHLFSWTG
jgi:hypothetical protein